MSFPHRPAGLRALLTLILALAAASRPGAAVAPRSGPALPDYDAMARAVRAVPVPAAFAPARARFGEGTRLRLDPATGLPAVVTRAGAGPLSVPAPRLAPEAAARAFLEANHDLFPFSAGERDSLVVVGQARDEASGTTFLRFGRRVDGVRLFGGELRIAVGRDGAVLVVSSSRLRPAARQAAPFRGAAPEALRAMAEALGVDGSGWDPALVSDRDGVLLFERGPFRSPVRAERVWFLEGDRLVPAWKGVLAPPADRELYQVVVEDGTGRLLHRRDVVLRAVTRGDVFPENPLAGPREVTPFPDATDLVVLESPDGWASADETTGPNVDAKDDRAADDETTPGVRARATGTGTPADPLLFDDPFTGDPAQDLEAGVTSLFYFANRAHDYFYRLGFDEASGNFQARNFGRGGEEGDPILADAQDSGEQCNARFFASPDGVPGRIEAYLWHPGPNCDPAGGTRDSDLDGDIILHEYAHGVSTRLVGSRDEVMCLFGIQSAAMGEGWSDYFAGSFFDDPLLGEYSTFDSQNGLRTQPMDAPNGRYTYGQLCTISTDPIFPCEPHADGEIWAQALWDLRATLIGLLGQDEGVATADRLVVTGMKFTGCRPSFLDARDGILSADLALYSGANRCAIWEVFARAGMGAGASSANDNDQAPAEDFQVPPMCVDAGEVRLDRESYLCSDSLVVTVTDGDASGPLQVLLTTTGGDSLTVDLPGPGPVFVSAPVPLEMAAVDTGDGVLQAAGVGETITASYTDGGSGASSQDTAVMDCTARVRVLAANVVEESCDDDSVPEFPRLPRFLDAGESGVLRVQFENATPGRDLTGVTVTLTSSHPAVTISPSTPIPLGDLAAPAGDRPGREIVLDFSVTAAAPLPSPDLADFSLNLTADGALQTVGDDFQLVLNQDWEQVPATLTEDFESGAPDWIHTPGSPPADEWNLVSCNGNFGPSSYHNGTSDCGDYSDDQENPLLGSWPLAVAPGTAALRVDRIEFWHNVDLGAFPISGYAIDVDAVVLQLQNEPLGIDLSDPFALLAESLAAYADLPALGYDSNTGGQWVRQEILPPPEASERLDPAVPVRLVWAFLPDVSDIVFPCSNPLCDVQGGGYYLDDVTVDYVYVHPVAQAAACASNACEVGLNVDATVVGPSCPGDRVRFDASASGAVNCPDPLEFTWTDSLGTPVSTTPELVVDPVVETAEYTVEAVCPSVGGCGESRRVKVLVPCDAMADVSATSLPAVVCPGATLDLDGAASRFGDCPPGGMEFRWTGPGGPLGGFSTDPTAMDTAPAATPASYVLDVRRQGNPVCADTATLDVDVECGLVADPDPVAGQPICAGSEITLDAGAGTGLSNCSGPLEYRWSGGNIAAPAYKVSGQEPVTIDADTTYTLDVRRSDWNDCSAQAQLAVTGTDGSPAGSLADVLRVSFEDRASETVRLDWSLGPLVPDDYSVHRSADPALLSFPGVTGATEVTSLSASGESYPGPWPPDPPGRLLYYRVFGVNFCTGELADP